MEKISLEQNWQIYMRLTWPLIIIIMILSTQNMFSFADGGEIYEVAHVEITDELISEILQIVRDVIDYSSIEQLISAASNNQQLNLMSLEVNVIIWDGSRFFGVKDLTEMVAKIKKVLPDATIQTRVATLPTFTTSIPTQIITHILVASEAGEEAIMISLNYPSTYLTALGFTDISAFNTPPDFPGITYQRKIDIETEIITLKNQQGFKDFLLAGGIMFVLLLIMLYLKYGEEALNQIRSKLQASTGNNIPSRPIDETLRKHQHNTIINAFFEDGSHLVPANYRFENNAGVTLYINHELSINLSNLPADHFMLSLGFLMEQGSTLNLQQLSCIAQEINSMKPNTAAVELFKKNFSLKHLLSQREEPQIELGFITEYNLVFTLYKEEMRDYFLNELLNDQRLINDRAFSEVWEVYSNFLWQHFRVDLGVLYKISIPTANTSSYRSTIKPIQKVEAGFSSYSNLDNSLKETLSIIINNGDFNHPIAKTSWLEEIGSQGMSNLVRIFQISLSLGKTNKYYYITIWNLDPIEIEISEVLASKREVSEIKTYVDYSRQDKLIYVEAEEFPIDKIGKIEQLASKLSRMFNSENLMTMSNQEYHQISSLINLLRLHGQLQILVNLIKDEIHLNISSSLQVNPEINRQKSNLIEALLLTLVPTMNMQSLRTGELAIHKDARNYFGQMFQAYNDAQKSYTPRKIHAGGFRVNWVKRLNLQGEIEYAYLITPHSHN